MRDAPDLHSAESLHLPRHKSKSHQGTKESTVRYFQWKSSSEFLIMSIGAHSTLMTYGPFINSNTREVGNIIQIIVMYVLIGIPISYMQVVIGQYTHLGLFFLKRMLPLGEGLSYACCLSIFATCVCYVLLMETFFLYLIVAFEPSKLQWMFCMGEYKNICWEPDRVCTDKKCVGNGVYLAAYVYWNHTFMQGTSPPATSSIGPPDISRIWGSLLCWICIYVVSIVEFIKLKQVCKIMIISTVILKIILTSTLMFMEGFVKTLSNLFVLDPLSFFSAQAWKNATRRVLRLLVVGDCSYMMFGVFSNDTTHTGTLMCFNGIISFAMELLNWFLIGSSTIALLHNANIDYSERHLLYQPKSAEFSLAVIPSALGLKTGSRIWTISYFLIRCFTVLLRVVTAIIILQQALYQRFTGLLGYYKYISPVFCVVGFGLGCLLESKEAYEIQIDLRLMIGRFCEHVNILILCVFVFYIYGTKRLCDDIHFMTGSSPTMFWKITWIAAPIILLWSLPFHYLSNNHTMFPRRWIIILLMICPYIIVLTVMVIKKVIEKNIISLFRPHPNWGPPDPHKLEMRKKFNPRQETKYKKRLYGCQHKCLVGNKFLTKSLNEEDTSTIGEIAVI